MSATRESKAQSVSVLPMILICASTTLKPVLNQLKAKKLFQLPCYRITFREPLPHTVTSMARCQSTFSSIVMVSAIQ